MTTFQEFKEFCYEVLREWIQLLLTVVIFIASLYSLLNILIYCVAHFSFVFDLWDLFCDFANAHPTLILSLTVLFAI